MKNVNLLVFEVHGPFDVPCEKKKVGRIIPLNCPTFWKQHSAFADRQGCYVFVFKAAKGWKPIYVGKTKKCFKEEAFTSHKIAQHYGPALADQAKGTPKMFLVVAPKQPGPANAKKIKQLETFLIQVAATKNSDLSNIQENSSPEWSVKNVVRGGAGKPTGAAKLFKKALGF